MYIAVLLDEKQAPAMPVTLDPLDGALQLQRLTNVAEGREGSVPLWTPCPRRASPCTCPPLRARGPMCPGWPSALRHRAEPWRAPRPDFHFCLKAPRTFPKPSETAPAFLRTPLPVVGSGWVYLIRRSKVMGAISTRRLGSRHLMSSILFMVAQTTTGSASPLPSATNRFVSTPLFVR